MDFAFRNIIQNMPLAYGLFDIIQDDSGRPSDCVFLEVNDKFVELTGLHAEELIGRLVSEAFPSGLADGFDILGACIGVTLAGEPQRYEHFSRQLRRAYSISAYCPEKGCFAMLASDITTEKAAPESAAEQEKTLKPPLDKAPYGILVVSGGGVLLEANELACQLSGYTEAEMQGIALHRLIVQDSRIQAFMFFKDMRARGTSSCQVQVQAKAGKTLWMALDARAMTRDRYIIYCQDITTYKVLEDDLVKSELLYRTFIDASTDYIYLKDDKLRFLIINDGLQGQYHLDYSDIIGKRDSELIPGDFAAEVELTDQLILDTNAPHEYEKALESVGLSYESRKFPVPIGNGKIGVGAYVRDVTEKKRQDETLKHLLEKTQAMFNEHGAVMLLLNPETGLIVDANPAAVAFYGYTREELLGLNIDDIHMLSPEEVAEHRWRSGEQNRKEYSFPHRLKDGTKRIVDVYSCLINDGAEQVLFSIIFDVTEREEAFEEIKYLSFHDHMTGLYNRRYFDSVLKLMNDTRFMPLAIVMADVNGLKLINDSFGHTEGDTLLKKAAEVITGGCRKDDIAARIGGDEFVIILPNTDEIEARKVVRRIRKLQSQVKIRQLTLTMSFGCAVKHEAESDIDLIFSDAENKMYKNKLHDSASTRSRTVNVIMKTLYDKCSGELEHARRVGKLGAAVATELGLTDEQVRQVEMAGLLHDIGKIGIDESILNKSGQFSKSDREAVKKHPASGWRILSNSEEYAGLAEAVLYHHEYVDGRGYPSGIKGDAIPLISRIIAVSDAYDAMTKDSTYRTALSSADAVHELQNFSGTQFDPEIVGVLVDKVLAGGKYDLS